MRFTHDRRGQSVVVGTVILFGFLLLALSLYQVQVVPTENANVEFEHSQAVEGDVTELRNAITTAGTVGDGRVTTVRLGTRYPQRTFFVNPPPVTGELRTTEQRQIRIENADVTTSGNAGKFWDAQTTDDTIEFDTRSLRYGADYRELQDGPNLVYEHSAVAAEYRQTALLRTGQTLVREPSGDSSAGRVTIPLLDGELSENGLERQSVDIESISASQRTVSLEPAAGAESIELVLPTAVRGEDRLDRLATEWNETLESGTAEVEGDDAVRLTITGESHRLRLGKIGVGSGTTAEDESDGYITEVSTGGGVAVAEVRDRFNNPVEDATVEVRVDGSLEETLRTDGNGRVEYIPDGRPAVGMRINDGDQDWETITFDSGTVGSGGGSGDDINPSGDSDVVLNDIGVRQPGQRTVDLQFRNDADEDREFQEVEFTLYYDPQGDTQESFTRGPDGTGQGVTLRDGFVELEEPFVIPAGGTATFTIRFGNNAQGDLLGLSFRDDLNRQALYLAGIEGEIAEEDNNGGDGDNSGSTEASQVNYVDGSGSAARAGGEERVDLDVRNTGSSDVVITAIEINSDAGNLRTLFETRGGSGVGQHEVYISSSIPGLLEQGGSAGAGNEGNEAYQLGTQEPLTEQATLAAGEQAQITLLEFRNSGGQTASAADSQVTMTLYFQDGSSISFTFTPPGYGDN
ncbi:hypothetical protein [Halorubrum sp. DTA46]|uniref:hypothetical protein n=1 Tax=Halorubrum sp. DTA46 TaxID=3402162 RepID=UPI003AAE5E05